MKARLVRNKNEVQLLCNDGTICNASNSILNRFFLYFDNVDSFTGQEGKWADQYFDMSDYPGETLAFVTDNLQLVLNDAEILRETIRKNKPDKYDLLTVNEYAKLHNRSKEMIKAFLTQGRIVGAIKIGRQWLIPKDAPYPIDPQSMKPTSGRIPKSAQQS